VEITQRGHLPVVSGGTGFYLKNFVLGLPDAPPSDPAIRETLKIDLARRGAEALMEELAAVDPISASRIHVNDTYRLLRALEVYRSSGRPLSSFAPSGAPAQDQEKSDRPAYRFLILGIQRDRDELVPSDQSANGVHVRPRPSPGGNPISPKGLRPSGVRD